MLEILIYICKPGFFWNVLLSTEADLEVSSLTNGSLFYWGSAIDSSQFLIRESGKDFDLPGSATDIKLPINKSFSLSTSVFQKEKKHASPLWVGYTMHLHLR